MSKSDLFPQKIAEGENFCNRITEQEVLRRYIKGVRPTLIISPRRYGKTSLGICVLSKLKTPYVHLDLFPSLNCEDVESVVLGGIGQLLGSIEATPKKAIKAVTEFFGALSVAFSYINAKVEVKFSRGNTRQKTLLNALISLDNILQKKKKNAVMFLDEFQRLGQLEGSEEIEGAIRHVAQQSKNLIFLFSGSNRHLLGNMFDERNKPLYKLCERIGLERISEEDYISFLNKKAKETWGKLISQNSLDAIFECTKCHPFYINSLCYRLWNRKTIFNEKEVLECWEDFVLGEKSSVFRELEGLSSNQLKLLVSLARYGKTESILNDNFLSFANIAVSSAKQALTSLQEKDYIVFYKNHYCILDPLIEYLLSHRI